MRNTIHVIEPTLASQAGHCFGYVQSIVKASTHPVEIWIDKKGTTLFKKHPIKCHGYFNRKLRKIQQYFLYKRLLKTGETLFIPTAGRGDMVMLDKLLSKQNSNSRIVFHFHQFSKSTKKLALLKQLAKRHPTWVILTPTERLTDVFQQAGFTHCHAVACPSYNPPNQLPPEPFRYALYAGATRTDKGFDKTVQAVLADNLTTPFKLQISAPESGRYDERSQEALKQLQQCKHQQLLLENHTLTEAEYLSQFNGSICLQPYDPESYFDKFSGVTLDAICSGAPVITSDNTWAADTVKKYQAGIVIADRKPETILSAIHTIKQDYHSYQQNCLQAREQLIEQHDAKHTVALLQSV